MTQQKNPQGSQLPSHPSQTSLNQSPRPRTRWGRRTEVFLMNVWEPLDLLGRGLMGDLWRTTYLSIQDAIALGILLKVPSLIGWLITRESFSSFDMCLKESALGATRYACFIIVVSDFCLWIVLAGRIIGRFWKDLSDLRRGQ